MQTVDPPVRRPGAEAPPARVHPGRWRPSSLALAAMVCASLAVQAFPAAVAALEFDRARVESGQCWRLITGQFVHCDFPHACSDLGALAALLWVGQRRWRGALVVVMLSAAAVGLALYGLPDGLATYRGVSGIGYAVLAWALTRQAMEDRSWRRAAWIALLAAAWVKALHDTVTGRSLLPSFLPEGTCIVGVVHVAGLAAGVLLALRRRKTVPPGVAP